MPVPTLPKEITCALLNHSPLTTLHMKIIRNVLLIYLGQHCARKLPVQCWLMVNIQPFLANNLFDVVSIKLGQHFIGISYTQCCPNNNITRQHCTRTLLAQY